MAELFKGRNTILFDLESQIDLNRLQNPQLMLGSLQELVIIDEIQEMPELFGVLRVLAHYHGQIWNASELGRSLDLSDKTMHSYLDILTGTFMVRQLQPLFGPQKISSR